ncbi:unnamed protein product [marine sediment metagenome]|uniref:Uncharacterized protein n=1 Tax=marine sediment metagenome TaxID=412755 RepID=X1JZH1_9ZZZZ
MMGKGAAVLLVLLLLVIVFLAAAWHYGYLDMDAIIEDIQGLFG